MYLFDCSIVCPKTTSMAWRDASRTTLNSEGTIRASIFVSLSSFKTKRGSKDSKLV
ncbi:hypothetical protein C8R44DRAFT_771528 [Mycena epipterygia]|nr:hypothetical protein C8R44DRAFT_771528 [Mycena epipterygia]